MNIITEGKYIRLVKRGSWEFVERKNANGVVAIITLTEDDCLLLVEQFRPPLNSSTIELPAGLVGDLVLQEKEDEISAASRELFEETGYQSDNWKPLGSSPVSPGLTNETISFYLATQAQQIGEGGGDENESIIIHKIPRIKINQWLQKQSQSGKKISLKVYAGLYFLQQQMN